MCFWVKTGTTEIRTTHQNEKLYVKVKRETNWHMNEVKSLREQRCFQSTFRSSRRRRWAASPRRQTTAAESTSSWSWMHSQYREGLYMWIQDVCLLGTQPRKQQNQAPSLQTPTFWLWPRSCSGCTLHAKTLNIWPSLRNTALLHTVAQVLVLTQPNKNNHQSGNWQLGFCEHTGPILGTMSRCLIGSKLAN